MNHFKNYFQILFCFSKQAQILVEKALILKKAFVLKLLLLNIQANPGKLLSPVKFNLEESEVESHRYFYHQLIEVSIVCEYIYLAKVQIGCLYQHWSYLKNTLN